MSKFLRFGNLFKKRDSATKQSSPTKAQPFASDPVRVNPFTNSEQASDAHYQESTIDDAERVLIEDPVQSDPELAAAELKIKKRLPLPSISNLIGDSYPLLAFQAGGFGLRGAVIQNTKLDARIHTIAESRAVDFTRAIAEVIAQLKEQHKRLPKRAILLTPSVATALVQLPVSPLRPRTAEQMQELIRWELEGAVSQQNKQWLIGSMLVERGYMTAPQRDDVVKELEVRQLQGGPQSLTRFGDVAVQLGYINREQLEECFTLQGKLLAVDDDLIYGWEACETECDRLSDEVLLSQDDDNDSSHPWLVSGMSKTVRSRWVGAFNLNNIQLEAFYPIPGCAFSHLWQHCELEQQFLLEVHQEQLSLISGTRKSVTEIVTAQRNSCELSLDECLNVVGVLPSEARRLYITSAENEDLSPLINQLTESLSIDVQRFSPLACQLKLPEGLYGDALIEILGAVNHYFKHTPASRQSWISGKEQTVSKWKSALKPKNLGIAASIVAVTGMLSFLGWMQWNTQYQSERLGKLEDKYNKELKIKKQLQALHRENQIIKQNIQSKEQEIIHTKTLLGVVEADINYSTINTAPLLKAIALARSTDIKLTSINKQSKQITIELTAPSNPIAQEFAATLNDYTQPTGYHVINSSPTESDLPGYSMSIELEFNASLVEKLLSENSIQATKGPFNE